MIRRAVSLFLLFGLLAQAQSAARACGPSYLQPIFVFEGSPDLPFEEFAAGKIGIVRPTFGRKTLLIAYRYLNGGSFAVDEQKELVKALEGEAPEGEGTEALKAWIAIRKEFYPQEELPEIYLERKTAFGRYDFFPNCAGNAFEVATSTLKDRAASYGVDDQNVREWVRGQDEVFQNCSGTSASIPQELAGVPVWLRKDRDYQIAAAMFYSLQFDQASTRFEKIADDLESDWRATAEYLVARTLVRQASLTEDPKKKAALYAKAEERLQTLIMAGNKFANAERKLMGLVKYRTHPEERAIELADYLSRGGASLDLRQDVIDYVWLLGKFEGQILKREHERREAAKAKVTEKEPDLSLARPSAYEAIARGDEIAVWFAPRFADRSIDFRNTINLQVKHDMPEAEILRLVEAQLNRKLTTEESDEMRERIKSSLDHRRWSISYNRKVNGAATDDEGWYDDGELKLTLADVPPFLLTNDLTDWILTLQLEGPETYARALANWRQTESPAWLLSALAKAERNSRGVQQLMRAAEAVSPSSPAFPTLAFHLVRLKILLNRSAEAEQLLDSIMTTQFDQLPVSAQNGFRAQRMQLAKSLTQFLRYAALKPAAFYDEGLYLTIRDLIETKKSYWEEYGLTEPKEEYEKELERRYSLLTGELTLFDEKTADILDRHLSLQLLQQAARDSQLSTYLRKRLVMLVWTRAILLGNHEIALQMAPEAIKAAPEFATPLTDYLRAKSADERKHAALYVLLKFPNLTPFLSGSLPEFSLAEDSDYYLGSAWWCEPSETEYRDGNEVPKVVHAPRFLDPNQVETAKREFTALSKIGDAKSFLGKQVLEWAKTSPEDPRIPEALFIAAKANEVYKYGCQGWENDKETLDELSNVLREQYPNSPWTAKLPKPDDR